MKKIIFCLTLLFLFLGCEREEECKTCTTFVYYYNTPIEIYETNVCGEQLEFWDGRYDVQFDDNGNIENFSITVCE